MDFILLCPYRAQRTAKLVKERGKQPSHTPTNQYSDKQEPAHNHHNKNQRMPIKEGTILQIITSCLKPHKVSSIKGCLKASLIFPGQSADDVTFLLMKKLRKENQAEKIQEHSNCTLSYIYILNYMVERATIHSQACVLNS